jgi:hypothetical protein
MGAWVYGDARTNTAGSFSAKVQLYTKETDIIIAGACAYASSYPPVGQYVSASEIVFTGTPMYEITLVHENGYTFETIESGGTFLLPCSYTVSSFTDKTGAPGILGCIPSTDIHNLTVSATTYCPGGTVTFALENTTLGRTYQLYKDNVEVMIALTGTGNAETFIGTFAGAGNYAARVKDNGTYCAAQMAGTYAVSENPTPGVPTMSGGGSQCGGTMDITATPGGNGGTGIRWTDGSGTATTPSRTVGNGTYYAVTTTDAGCESGLSLPVTVTIRQPGADGQAPDAVCGCVSGLANCGTTCKTKQYTYTNNGSCESCGYRYVQQWDQCGQLVTAYYSTTPDASCTSGCGPTHGTCPSSYYGTFVHADTRDECLDLGWKACAAYKKYEIQFLTNITGSNCGYRCCN